MGIYQLSIKNFRRNKLRNISAILRISVGVFILLVLVSSGLGISSFFQDTSSLNENIFSNNQSNSNNVTAIISAINSYVNSTFGVNIDDSKLLSALENYLPNIVYILDSIASLAFFIGVLNVLNAMNLNIAERKREIGILKSLGFSKNQILLSISLESGIFGFIGSLIGVILGSIALIFLYGFFSLNASVFLPFRLIIGIIVITTVLSLILGLLPAWFTSRLNIEEILKYE